MEKKTLKITCVVVLTVLSLLALTVNYIATLTYYPVELWLVELVPYSAIFLAIVYYAVSGYKKPHGDLLRRTMLVFSFSILSTVMGIVGNYVNDPRISPLELVAAGFMCLGMILISYMAGRLDKIKKNKVIMVCTTVFLLAKSILGYASFPSTSFVMIVWPFTTFILWLDLCYAYVLRYREHKEAGLLDK